MQLVINRRPVDIPVLPVLTVILLLIGAFTSIRISRIQANQIGVYINNLTGEITVNTIPGAEVYNGWITDFYLLDNTEQSFVMSDQPGGGESVNIKTRDGADVTLDVAINYRLVADAQVIKDRVIPECGLDHVQTSQGRLDAYKVKWIRDFARSIIRYKFGELTPNSFYDAGGRAEKGQESEFELNELLNPHGINVTLVAPQQFSFYTELETMITDKQAAEQEVEAEKAKATAALQAQLREKTKATARLNVGVAAKEGELRQAILAAEAQAERFTKQAEAYAYSARTEADAGFYKAQNDSKSMLARAEAEAAGMTQLAESLSGDGASNLVKLRYAEALLAARITGVPYATDPRIQKVELDTGNLGDLRPTGPRSAEAQPAEGGGK